MTPLGLLLLACAPGAITLGEAPAPDSGAPDDPPRVVVVVLDGARLDESFGDGITVTGAATDSLLPVLRARLWPAGTVVRGAWSSGVPITTEAHTELFTGLRQDLATFPPAEGAAYKSDVPTLFELVGAQGAVDPSVMVVNTVLVEDLAWSAWPDLGEAFGATHRFRTDDAGADLSDPVVLTELKAWLATHDTRLGFANLHAIDLAGHDGVAEDYEARVRSIDEPLTQLWDWLQATPPYAGNTTLVVLADHGRHDGDDWSGHGDQCLGCRAIPLFFAGPGIAAGATVDASATLADVARTIAFQLGVDLPLGRGRVLRELFAHPPDVPEARAYGVAAMGDHVAVDGVTDAGHGVAIDGVLTSDPRALHAEVAALADLQGGLVACWRELVTDDGGAWAGRCTLDGAELAFPETAVSPRWAPSLVADGDALWAAYTDNPNGYTGVESGRTRLVRWDATEGWVGDDHAGPSRAVPTRPSLARVGGGSVVAFASSEEEIRGRDTRQVEVWRVSGDTTQTWTRVAVYAPDTVNPRLEAPALRADGAAVAMFGYGDDTRVLLGERGVLTTVDPAGRALPHLGLAWVGDTPVWARLSAGGTVEVCRGDGVVVDTRSAVVTGIAATEEGFWAVVEGAVVRYPWG